ncbi:hypothetical protein [Lactobacillus helveticus]|nr:hypothetical protein [Lactobacillus helveticus]
MTGKQLGESKVERDSIDWTNEVNNWETSNNNGNLTITSFAVTNPPTGSH